MYHFFSKCFSIILSITTFSSLLSIANCFLTLPRVICDKDNIPDNKCDPDNLKNVILQPPAILNSIQSFFKYHYSHTMQFDDYHTLDFNLMSQSIQHETDTLITALETHISEHFRDMFFTHCNLECYLDKKCGFVIINCVMSVKEISGEAMVL